MEVWKEGSFLLPPSVGQRICPILVGNNWNHLQVNIYVRLWRWCSLHHHQANYPSIVNVVSRESIEIDTSCFHACFLFPLSLSLSLSLAIIDFAKLWRFAVCNKFLTFWVQMWDHFFVDNAWSRGGERERERVTDCSKSSYDQDASDDDGHIYVYI